MLIPAVILMLAGLLILGVAVASWRERLPRNRLAGVRTPATMRSDQAFRIANKAAAPLTGAGGLVLAVGGVLAEVLRGPDAAAPLILCALTCAALCIAGAVKGVRASR